MKIEEALDYLYGRLPMYQNVGKKAYTAKLDNILAISQAMGNPHKQFRSIHVGGTNGKGSTSHMLASILQECGYKVGLSTSPHLIRFNERIRINGQEIPDHAILDFVSRYKATIEQLNISFFEVSTAMMFWYFAQEQVDIAIIEVGLGGRLDSTNIISPILSLITNIGLDHVDILGDTLPQIALDKAGIIKAGTPIIISEKHPETTPVFQEVAQSLEAPLHFAQDQFLILRQEGDQYRVRDEKTRSVLDIKLDLQGSRYQSKNLLGVLNAIDILLTLGFEIGDEDLTRGLRQVTSNTHLKGRWQILGQSPMIICDTAHNVAAFKEILEQLQSQDFDRLHMVLGFVHNKDVDGLLSLLPKGAKYYLCAAQLPRALPLDQLAQKASEQNLNFTAIGSVCDAFAKAQDEAQAQDLIYIGGSTFVVAELLSDLSL